MSFRHAEKAVISISVIVRTDVIGVDVVASGYVRVSIVKNYASLVKRQNVFVSIFQAIFWPLTDGPRLVTRVNL